MTDMSAFRSKIFFSSSLVPAERPLILAVRIVTVDWDFFHLLNGLLLGGFLGWWVTITGGYKFYFLLIFPKIYSGGWVIEFG